MAKGAYIGVPKLQPSLGDLDVGSIVKLNVSGVATEFIIVHHGNPKSTLYDSSCDGTWLLMKDIYEKRAYTTYVYQDDGIHSYLNGEFFGKFDTQVQNAIKEVKLPWHKDTATQSGTRGFSTKVFLLAGREVGFPKATNIPGDGECLDYFSSVEENISAQTIRVAYFEGVATAWWTRSTYETATIPAIAADGSKSAVSYSSNYGIRPAVILPSTIGVNAGTVDGDEPKVVPVAHKVKKGYLGIDSLARKIKKAYVGIGGVARPCWGSDPIEYYGEITSLNRTMFEHVGVSAGNYAIFAGGASSNCEDVNAYDSSLTRTVAADMIDSRFDFAGAYVAESGHTFFAGGLNDDDALVADVDVYDSSLTKLESETLGTPREQLASATVGKYALFAGGLAEGEEKSTEVEYFYQGTSSILDGSMPGTKDLQTATRFIVGGTNGTHALFYGSESSSTNKLDAYDASLTYSKNTSVGAARRFRSIARAGNFAIVAGGQIGALGGNPAADMNLAIDQSLTITFVDDLQEARRNIKSTSLGGYAMFVGGYTGDSTVGNTSKKIDLYDSSLVHTIANDLNGGREDHAVASVGNYALVAGGYRYNGTSTATTASVEAYVLNETN